MGTHSLSECGEGEGEAGGEVECGEAGTGIWPATAPSSSRKPSVTAHLRAEWGLVVHLSISFSWL